MESAVSFFARLVTLGGVLLALGATVFRVYVLRRAAVRPAIEANASRRAATIALYAAIAIVPAALVKLVVQTADMRFPDDPWVSVAIPMITETEWGTTWLAQFACALLLIPAALLAKRGTMRAWIPAALLSAALAITPSTSSHAMSANKFAAITVYIDVLHIFAASSWLGTLFVMYCSARGDAPVDESTHYLARLLSEFSPLALTAGVLVVVSGLISSFSHIAMLREFITTDYGRMLIAKVASVGVVMLFGFRNFKYLTPMLARSGAATIRRSMMLELAATVVVLLVTGVLVVTPPPMTGGDMHDMQMNGAEMSGH